MMRRLFVAFALFIAAQAAALGQSSIQTFPPDSVWGRIGNGTYGPGSAIPLSTLAANLGVGTLAHSVPIGKGTTVSGFNSATTGTSGAVLIDQGAGADPAFVGITGSCTLAANGAMSCSGVGAGVTLVDGSVTPAYTALGSDCLKTIAVYGGAQTTLTVNSAATYNGGGACSIDILNNNSWANPAGVVLSVSGLTTNPPVLYPGMSITLVNVNGTWAQKPGVAISRAPVGTKLYVDGVNGSDGADCLTTTTACKTLNHVVMGVIYNNLEVAAGSATGGTPGFDVRLIANPGCTISTGANCIAGLHMSGLPRRSEGHNSIMIECDAGSGTDCTISDNTGSQAIGVYCACFLQLKNVTLAGGNGNNSAIQVEMGMVRLQGGVILTAIPTSPLNAPQISALNNGIMIGEGGAQTIVSGGAAFLATAEQGGRIQLDQHTVTWIGASTYSATLAAFAGYISTNGISWQNTGNVTSTYKIQCTVGGAINTNNAVASVPGTSTALGCTNTANGSYN
ncbi:hypothetical protein [Bradyrhizobium sp. HKCCYLS2033]|uniref:hypothetical protein n=1 Tax=Bradyrhizobium sp. HKCCYLS2033 TaxID=3420739 RepID=UPI003EBCAA35